MRLERACLIKPSSADFIEANGHAPHTNAYYAKTGQSFR